MENDGTTRVWGTQGGQVPYVRQLWPEYQNAEDAFLQVEATQILTRAEFMCVNSESFEPGTHGGFGKQIDDDWSCRDTQSNDRFNVDRSQWSPDERYSKLAEILEERTGKKGLTIVVS